jgi:preprotein translocase subunit SecB
MMMKVMKSALGINDIALTQMDFKINFPQPHKEFDVRAAFNSYEVDVDFHVVRDEEVTVFIKAEVNRGGAELPGYSIMAEVACIYQMQQKHNLTVQQVRELEGFSTIYIALNALRGMIANVTASAPFGRYILPSIDLNDLIRKKMSENEKRVAEKKEIKSTVKKKVAKKK